MCHLFHPTSCTSTKSNLYLANYLAAAVRELVLSRLLTFQIQNPMPQLSCLFRAKLFYQQTNKEWLHKWKFRHKIHLNPS
jgi:hypothetical protein